MSAILFDFGGTLDTNGIHWSEKFRVAYEDAGLGIKLDDFNEAYVNAEPQMYVEVKKNDGFYTTLLKQSYLQLNYLEKNKNYNFTGGATGSSETITKNCYEDVLKNIKIVGHLLLSLSKNYKLGVVSNFYGNLEASLKSLKIDHYFDVLIDSTLAGVRKPDPEIFEIAINNLKVNPENTIVVGDSYERDIKPAKMLNCKTIWLDVSSWARPGENSSADFIIKNFVDIREIIYKLFPR